VSYMVPEGGLQEFAIGVQDLGVGDSIAELGKDGGRGKEGE